MARLKTGHRRRPLGFPKVRKGPKTPQAEAEKWSPSLRESGFESQRLSPSREVRHVGEPQQLKHSQNPKTPTHGIPYVLSMTLKKWVRDPNILGIDQPFFQGHGDSRWALLPWQEICFGEDGIRCLPAGSTRAARQTLHSIPRWGRSGPESVSPSKFG